jgi:tetratricopeptide (TPR) repeat protein
VAISASFSALDIAEESNGGVIHRLTHIPRLTARGSLPPARPHPPTPDLPKPRGEQLQPINGYIYFLRALLHVARHDPDMAIEDLTQAIRLGYDSAMVFSKRAEAYRDRRDFESAIADFTEAMARDTGPRDRSFAPFVHERGLCHHLKGDLDRAIADYSEAILLDPLNQFFLFNRSKAFRARGDRESANIDLLAANRRSIKYLLMFLRHGLAYGVEVIHRSMIEGLDEAIRLDPKSPDAFYNRGIAYDELRENQQAIDDYAEALRLDPTHTLALFKRASAFNRAGDPQRAIADLTEAIQLAPFDAALFTARGDLHNKLADFDRALADFDEAIRLDPTDASAHTRRGVTYWRMGNVSKAMENFNEAIGVEPIKSWALKERGRLHHDAGDLDRAIEDYSTALAIVPFDADLLCYRGDAFINRGDIDRALADYTEAIGRSRSWAEPYFGRGRAHYNLADFTAAVADLTRVAEIEPEDMYAPLWLHLARLRAGHDASVAAAELQRHAAAFDPKKWPYPLVELLLGERTQEETLACAGSADERSEAQFYIGSRHLLRGDRAAAIAAFKIVAETCPKDFVEFIAAQAELNRLEQ